MRRYSQVTDSNLSFENRNPIWLYNDTSGGEFHLADSWHQFGTNPVRAAYNIISKIENSSVAEQTDKLLSSIFAMTAFAQKIGLAPPDIPQLHAHIMDDGSVLLEWIFPDFRVGFNIEPDPEDSGWHLVSSKLLGEKSESGQLRDINEKVGELLGYIFSNS